jgi:alanine dehydrogenase
MIIGTVKEIKRHEYRVGLTPDCVKAYVAHGHKVLIESNAGIGAGFSDEKYKEAGAEIIKDRQTVFDDSEMIVKVKEPQPEEYGLLHQDQILYTYLHLAADKPQAEALMKCGVKAIAYETIETDDGQLPCLKPMSEIAGRLAIQEGAKYLEKPFGGRGILLGGVPGIERGKVTIIGAGVVGTNACKIAIGMGADVRILDVNAKRLEYLDDIFGSGVTTLYSTPANIERVSQEADVLIGAVLLPGAKAPNLIKREHLPMMKNGAVLVDVAVDQGGCFETTRATTHDDPVYTIDGVVHYAVANMPGAVALSSTLALTSTTLPHGLAIANKGLEKAIQDSAMLRKGLNIYKGRLIYKRVALDLDLPFTPLQEILT